MRLYKRKDSPHWWVTWNDQDGKRHRRSSGTEDRNLAQALGAKWVEEGFLEKHFGKKPDVAFSEALLRYAKTHKRDHAKHFNGMTRYVLKRLAERFGHLNISQITYAEVQAFLDERLETVSLSTAQKDVTILKAILNKACREGLIDSVPPFPRLKTLKPRQRWLTTAEEDRLVTGAAPHLQPLIRFAVDTGGRLSELLGLDWKEVDMAERRIRFVETKNGEDRTIRLCDRAYETLKKLGPRKQGIVFLFNGKPIKRVQKAFVRARERAGLKDVRFHDLRHTFASRLVQAGIPLYDVMHLTGHKSLAMVQRYSHLAPDYQTKAISALDRLHTPSGYDLVTEAANQNEGNDAKSLRENGAGEEIRTLDPNLGKVVLYH